MKENTNILIVDDDPINLVVLEGLLQDEYGITKAEGGVEALAVASRDPSPDLILLDVMMPDIDGYEVIKRLNDDPATCDIPVIFVTALDSVGDEETGLKLGAVDYVTKPVHAAILHARVRTHLHLKRVRDQIAEQNQSLEAEVHRRLQQTQRVQDVSLRALSSLAATRDNETGAHILRTQGYVNLLCNELASRGRYPELLTEDGIRNITLAAPLHDIGKVGIPDRILLKPGKLDAAEWETMQTHARLGAEAIRRAIGESDAENADYGFLDAAIEIAERHHEKWDGSGYPDGLAEEQIPLSARMMALADVFDALISKRVYKKAFSLEETAQIITDGRAKHFDPELVDIFLSVRPRFVEIAERHKDAQHS